MLTADYQKLDILQGDQRDRLASVLPSDDNDVLLMHSY